MKLPVVSVGFALLLAVNAFGQGKTTGTVKCAKADPAYSLEVGDRPGHVMVLGKQACTWPEPADMAGDKTKDGVSIVSVDITTSRETATGSHVGTTEGGDKWFVSYRYGATMKDGKPGEIKGTWSYTGGTGKLKGIKGGGTFTSMVNDDGSVTSKVDGTYELPAAGATKKKQ